MYTEEILDGDLFTVEEFKDMCVQGYFYDDGFGYIVKDGMMSRLMIVDENSYMDIPKDATHVIWFNK